MMRLNQSPCLLYDSKSQLSRRGNFINSQFAFQLSMGNSNNGKEGFQQFYQLCHPGLIQYQLDTKQQLLFSQIKIEESFIIWRKLADPLFAKKHLLMPLKIVAPQHFIDYGCCAQEDFYRTDMQSKTIYYQLFVFTLDREIASRRQKGVRFREQQLWKLLKYMARAAIEWQEVYPLEPIGSICPFNVLINPNGNVRLVCRLSFFNNEYALASEVYSPPQSRQNSMVKYSLNPSKDPVGIEASEVYSIGMVLLETLTLQVSGVSLIQTVQKQSLMAKSAYGSDLKELINRMLDHNQALRPKMHQLLQQAKFHRSRHI